jgi:RNA polymerase sigma-70 factor (ECF subfamily)
LPDRQVERAQDGHRLSRALEVLSPEQRMVVELAYFDGLSQSEIAARTGDPLGTVKWRARTALEKLAEHLSEELA